MKNLYRVLLVLAIMPGLAIAGDHNYNHTKRKMLSKDFEVSKTCEVKIDNSFGSVTITTWDQPRVELQITVIVSGNQLDEVEDRLRRVDVAFEESTKGIAAVTSNIGNNSNGSFWDIFSSKDSKGKIEVNYVVKMPVTASLDISNDYGAIILDRLEGNAKIRCDFGRLDIGMLMGGDNEIKFDYTKNSSIDYMASGIIRADFSGFELGEAVTLDFKGDYTQAHIKKVKKLNFNSDFSGVRVDQVASLTGRGDYSKTRLGRVMGGVDLTTDFGSIDVQQLMSGFQKFKVKSDYTHINIRFDPAASFNFHVDTEYAGITLDRDCQLQRSEIDGSDKLKSGYFNSADTGNNVDIKASFGSVKIKSN
ncbi:MAG: hypothetical protein WBA16_05340 [Nonlabens sp.]